MKKPQLMHLLASYLDGRVGEMSPQNMANVANAYARLDCYSQQLFFAIQERIVIEDLSAYKLYELANLTHSLAKLNCGGKKIYRVLFEEAARRGGAEHRRYWEPRSVVQLLDAMRRKQACYNEDLLLELMHLYLGNLRVYEVQQLTQATWCLVELDALELARSERALQTLHVPCQGDETPSRCIMRIAMERMEELHLSVPLTPRQLSYVQQLVRAYHYKHEVEYGLQPFHVKAFCKSLFDLPTSMTSSLARRQNRRGRP